MERVKVAYESGSEGDVRIRHMLQGEEHSGRGMTGTKVLMQEHVWHVQVSPRGQWGYSDIGKGKDSSEWGQKGDDRHIVESRNH